MYCGGVRLGIKGTGKVYEALQSGAWGRVRSVGGKQSLSLLVCLFCADYSFSVVGDSLRTICTTLWRLLSELGP